MENCKERMLQSTCFAMLVVLLMCCKGKVESTLQGTWTIDTLYYKDDDITRCVLSNIVVFDGESCGLPITKRYCEGLVVYKAVGTWDLPDIDTIPLVLRVETENEIFAGSHRLTFRRDRQNRLLKMELHSDNLYVVCRKALFSFERNQELMDDLIKRSH